MDMDKIDISSLIEIIENSFIDNGFVLEVVSAFPEEVVDEVRYNDTFTKLSKHLDIIEAHQWVKIAYGNTFAFVGVKSDEDKLEVFVDVSEDCIIDDFEQMLVDGIKDYTKKVNVNDVKIILGDVM
jgi:hypothetical protein